MAGWALLAGGTVAWARRPCRHASRLLVLSGATWFAGDVAGALAYAHRGPLVQLLLAYPGVRVRSRVAAVVVGVAYVDGLVPVFARSAWPTVALMAAVVMAAGAQHRAAAGADRRPASLAFAGALTVGGALALAAASRISGADADGLWLWLYYVAVTVTALGLTVDLVWGGSTRAAVTDLVIDLGDRHEPQALRTALARAVGDPDLQVAYRVAGADAWVDELGRAVDLPRRGSGGRAVTLVHEEGEAVAALVHDQAVLADGPLASSVAAAARLAVANAGMQAQIAERLREVDASRRRLIEAGDDERRQLGEELHTGVERRLAAVSAGLGALAARREGEPAAALRRLSDELEDARGELRRFGAGVHPRSLTERGLAPAVAELATRSAVPVTLSVVEQRFATAHEAAVFFVCSEGLANAAKYAHASRVEIAVTATDDRLRVRLADDGRGGAEIAGGSGLRGLTDRLQALGGALRVDSPIGIGTTLEAELPIPRRASAI